MNNYIFYTYLIYKKINKIILHNNSNNYVYNNNYIYQKKLKFNQMFEKRII